MSRRLLPILLAASCLAEPPRPADLGDTWNLSGKVRHDIGGGQDGFAIDSSAVRLEFVTQLTQLDGWRLSLSGAAGAEGHDIEPGAVAGLPKLESVRELDLGLVLSKPAGAQGGPSRFYALELGTRTADAAGLEEGVSASFAGGSSWKINETFTLGYMILAENREADDDLFLVVPTFRWAFAQDWTLATGRKSLVLSNQLAKDESASLTLGYEGEETRLEDLAGQEARVLDQRLYADLGYAWKTGGWELRATLGCEIDGEMEFQVGGGVTKVDPGQGLRLGIVGRIKL
jgi:hypothetical protein